MITVASTGPARPYPTRKKPVDPIFTEHYIITFRIALNYKAKLFI